MDMQTAARLSRQVAALADAIETCVATSDNAVMREKFGDLAHAMHDALRHTTCEWCEDRIATDVDGMQVICAVCRDKQPAYRCDGPDEDLAYETASEREEKVA